MKRYKGFAVLFLLLTIALAIFYNRLTLLDCLLLIVSLLLSLFIVIKFPLSKHIAKYVCVSLIYMSVLVLPAYHMVILDAQDIVENDYVRLISFGAKVNIVACLAFIINAAIFAVKNHKYRYIYKPKLINNFTVIVFFIFCFLLSIFCLVTGLGRMGREAIVLPFHLGGIINLFRGVLVPFLFASIVENHILCGKKVPRLYYVVFTLWVVLEVFVWMSKGRLIYDFLPLSIVLILNYKPSIRVITKYIAPIILVFLFLYPIIAIMRGDDMENGNIIESYSNAREVSKESGLSERILIPINRTFMTPSKYIQDYEYISQDKLFDFSKTIPIFAVGGAAAYQTFVIDGYPPSAVHSSGTTGIIDPLLHGGFGLCYIIIFLLLMFSAFIDRSYYKRQTVIYVQLLLMLFFFVVNSNITSFYDGVGIQTLITRLLSIVLAYNLCYKNKTLVD